jgi:hypothetical protein
MQQSQTVSAPLLLPLSGKTTQPSPKVALFSSIGEMSAALRSMKGVGISPRPSVTKVVYRRPPHYLSNESVLPPLTTIPPLSPTFLNVSVTPEKLPPPSPIASSSGEEDVPLIEEMDSTSQINSPSSSKIMIPSSPSVERSPLPARRGELPPSKHNHCKKIESDQIPQLPNPKNNETSLLISAGYFPFLVIQAVSGSLIFTVTPLGDRVAIFYPNVLRDSEIATVESETVRECSIVNAEDASKLGVFDLAQSAGLAIARAGASPTSNIIGTLAFSLNRYVAIIFKTFEDETPSFLSLEATPATPESVSPVYTYGVVPIIHSFPYSNAGHIETLTKNIRTSTRRIEEEFLFNSSRILMAEVKDCSRQTEKSLEVLANLIAKTSLAKESALIPLTKQRPTTQRESEKISKLSTFSAKAGEILGKLRKSISTLTNDYVLSVDQALSELSAESSFLVK